MPFNVGPINQGSSMEQPQQQMNEIQQLRQEITARLDKADQDRAAITERLGQVSQAAPAGTPKPGTGGKAGEGTGTPLAERLQSGQVAEDPRGRTKYEDAGVTDANQIKADENAAALANLDFSNVGQGIDLSGGFDFSPGDFQVGSLGK